MQNQTPPQTDPAPSLIHKRNLRLVKAIIGVIVIASSIYISAAFAAPRMFISYQPYDDEGASLMTLSQLAQGHVMYDQVVTMYGPIGFLPKVALVKLLHLPINHDMGRALTLVLWLLTSCVLAMAAWRLSGSVAWFGLGMMASCVILERVIAEPGHPQDICGLLLALAVLASTFGSEKHFTRMIVILGIFAGLLCMTKINLGAFYVAALGSAMLCQISWGRWHKLLLRGLVAVLAICPFALMLDDLHQGWCFCYAMEISLALLACYVAANWPNVPLELQAKHLLICAAAWFCTIVGVIVLCLGLGMSLAGLYEGVIRLPLHLSKSFTIPFTTNGYVVLVAVCGLAMAHLAARRAAINPTPPSAFSFLRIGILRIGVALITLYFVYQNVRPAVLALSPEFVWLLLLPVQRKSAGHLRFARMFLAFLAIFEAMWAYPVSGTQLSFATFLSVLAMVVTLSDGVVDIAAAIKNVDVAFVWQIAASATMFIVAFFVLNRFAVANKASYDHYIPLNLPGSSWIHLPADDAPVYELVAANLKANADVFYSAPGLFSLNFWTEIPPPTSGNVTGWMYILTDAQQQQIVDVLAAHPRACFVYLPKLVDFWMQKKVMPRGPLIKYIASDFRHAYDVFSSQIWVRKDRKFIDVIKEDGTTHRVYLKPE